jgi:hypothetical protein
MEEVRDTRPETRLDGFRVLTRRTRQITSDFDYVTIEVSESLGVRWSGGTIALQSIRIDSDTSESSRHISKRHGQTVDRGQAGVCAKPLRLLGPHHDDR